MIRSPRYTRPHRMIIRNRIGEVEGTAYYQSTTINHVNIDTSYGIKQSQKGVQSEGSAKIVIDMNDIVAFEGIKKRTYLDPFEFEKLDELIGYFTIRPDVDFIRYKDKEYTIVSISEGIAMNGCPIFLEVIANG